MGYGAVECPPCFCIMVGKTSLTIDISELSEGETRVFEILWGERIREAFVLRYDGAVYVFLNECPHWSVELDLGDGHFFDPALDRIYCKNHGALFFPRSGLCETGPCLGRSLIRLHSEFRNNIVEIWPEPWHETLTTQGESST